MKRLWIAILMLLVLSACTPLPVKVVDPSALMAAQQAREASLAAVPSWSFRGRLAVSQAGNGGSGSIEWHQTGEDFDIRLAAPITRQSWRLLREGGQVRLEGLEGGTRTGMDAEALLLDASGWRIPVEAMSDWVRGARSGGPSDIGFAANGLPDTLSQQAWTVQFRSWDDADPARPLKVFARSGDASVRLVIDAWESP